MHQGAELVTYAQVRATSVGDAHEDRPRGEAGLRGVEGDTARAQPHLRADVLRPERRRRAHRAGDEQEQRSKHVRVRPSGPAWVPAYTPPVATLVFDKLRKSYGDTEVLTGIDLTVDDGEYLVLVGPSGCGKSTLLRCIAGLEDITSGELRIGDRRVNDVSPKDRDVAMVFQSYALYPHMSDASRTSPSDLRFAGEVADAEVRAPSVAEVAEHPGDCPHLLDRKPGQLSGGQRQRVAMGRAIARQPSVFLFDEPLSNLDAALRGHMRVELKRLHRELGTTVVHVTHDQVEALTLATRILVLHDGVVQQIGTPRELFDTPANTFVAQFIGSPPMNLLPATDGVIAGVGTLVDAPGTTQLGVRASDFVVGDGPLEATVDVVESLGATALVHLVLGDHAVVAEVSEPTALDAGEVVRLGARVVHVFGEDGERR